MLLFKKLDITNNDLEKSYKKVSEPEYEEE